MRYLNQGRFQQQVRFLQHQFLQDGNLPFSDIRRSNRRAQQPAIHDLSIRERGIAFGESLGWSLTTRRALGACFGQCSWRREPSSEKATPTTTGIVAASFLRSP